jgi:hypothetical protein
LETKWVWTGEGFVSDRSLVGKGAPARLAKVIEQHRAEIEAGYIDAEGEASDMLWVGRI